MDRAATTQLIIKGYTMGTNKNFRNENSKTLNPVFSSVLI